MPGSLAGKDFYAAVKEIICELKRNSTGLNSPQHTNSPDSNNFTTVRFYVKWCASYGTSRLATTLYAARHHHLHLHCLRTRPNREYRLHRPCGHPFRHRVYETICRKCQSSVQRVHLYRLPAAVSITGTPPAVKKMTSEVCIMR